MLTIDDADPGPRDELTMTVASKVLLALIALMPVAIMSGQTVPSVIFYLTLLLALMLLIRHRFAGVLSVSARYRGPLAGVAALVPVVLFAALWTGSYEGTDLEIALRVLLGLWIPILALSRMPVVLLRQSVWGFIIAALLAVAYIIHLSWPDWVRPETDAVYNAVGYGDLTALLAVLVLFSTRWSLTRWPSAERILKWVIAMLALVGFILTQTRSGWVAAPVFAVIGVVLFFPSRKPVRIVLSALVVLAVLASVFLAVPILRDRAVLAYDEMVSCSGVGATQDTSICIRLQLWRASLDMLAERPLAGNGNRHVFNDYLQSESLPKGLVSPYVAQGWGEPHNDLLLALASYGVPGGIALLLIYLAPAWLFMRRLSFRNSEAARTAAAMGLAVCLGFLIFGLTETMFRSMRTVSFYVVCIALFMALSDPLQHHSSSQKKPFAQLEKPVL